MPEAIITQPKGPIANPVADFTLYKDTEGHDLVYPQRCEPWRITETILKYEAVALVAATASVPLSAEKLDISDALKAGNLFLGVAQEGGAAGDVISVCVQGVTLARIGTTDPIEGSAVVIGSADGLLDALLIGSQAATVIENTVFGVFLDVENASDIAPIRLYGH